MSDEDTLKFTVYLNKSYVWYSSADRIGINVASQINAFIQEWALGVDPPSGEKVTVTFDGDAS